MRSVSGYETVITGILKDSTSGTYGQNEIMISLNRGISYLSSRYALHISKNTYSIDIFPNLYSYELPSDFRDFISLQPQEKGLITNKTTPRQFKEQYPYNIGTVAIDSELGVKTLLANIPITASSQPLETCESLTQNGSWDVDSSTDAVGLSVDATWHTTGSSSFKFNVDVSQSANNYAIIENDSYTSTDLSAYENTGMITADIYLPTTSITSVSIRWGIDSSNYYESTVTTRADGKAFRVGTNTVGWLWNGSTQTGSSSTTIGYLAYKVTYAASFTDTANFRIDNIRIANPVTHELDYYSSNYVFDGDTGEAKPLFTQYTDMTMMDDEDDDLLLYFILQDAYFIKEDTIGMSMAKQRFEDLLSRIQARFSSERKKEAISYY